jgi:Site-specific recombinases, DNA invertase Pin homologs
MQTENSLESQKKLCEEFAKANGMIVVGYYEDYGFTGRNDQRPGFKRMIKDGKEDKYDVLLIPKFDRFFRNEELHRIYEYRLKKKNVAILSITDSLANGDSYAARLSKSVFLLQNEEESAKIGQHVKRGMHNKAQKGESTGGRCLGYDIDSDGKIVVNEKEATIIKTIFTMRSDGFSYSQIANELNKNGWKTKAGNSFNQNSFSGILANQRYKGILKYGDVETETPAIVSEELWEKAQSSAHNQPKKQAPKSKYLLGGIVQCSCDTYMHANKNTSHGTEYLSYICPMHKKKEGCDTLSIKKDVIEDFTLNAVVDKMLSSENVDQFIENFGMLDKKRAKARNKKISDTKNQINGLNEKKKNAIDKLTNECSKDVEKSLKACIDDCAKENNKLMKRLKKLENAKTEPPTKDEMKALRQSIIEYLKDENNLVKSKQFLQKVIESLVVDNDGINLTLKI